MKIAWLNDFDVTQHSGGAQVTNDIMINHGTKHYNHQIDLILPKEDIYFDEYDLFILNNINMFRVEQIDHIIDKKPYVTYNHDYLFCRYRNCRCTICPIFTEQYKHCIPNDFYNRFYINSKLNIFLSPLHLLKHKMFFKEIMRDAIYLPSPLLKGQFSNKIPFEEREDAYLYVGTLMPHKGVDKLIGFADMMKQQGKKTYFIGRPVKQELFDLIIKHHNYLGEVEHNLMPDIYNKYRYLITNPQWTEPFCRVLSEASASGCRLVKFSGSVETGYESYHKTPDQMIKLCEQSPKQFWDKINKI